jgi:hypothetical protein
MYHLKDLLMKKLIAILLIGVSSAASAQHHGHHYRHHGHHYRHHGHGHGGWIAPLVIGGALGYIISRPPVVVQPPVVMPPPPVVVQNPVPIYQEVVQYNTECECYVKTYQQIGWK